MESTDTTGGKAASNASECHQNKILYLAAGFAGLVVLASVALGIGENGETKMSFFRWAVGAAGVVLSTAMAALGYSVGQLFKGVIPEGMKALPATAPQTVVNVGPERVPMIEGASLAEFQPMRPVSGTFQETEGEPQPGTQLNSFEPRSLTGGKLGALLLPILLLVSVAAGGGCVGTSKQFKIAAPAVVNNVVLDMREYTAANDWDRDHNGTIEPSEQAAQAAETALTDALAEAVKDQETTTLESVTGAWQPVKPIWSNYVRTDPILRDPEDARIRLDTGRSIDNLIKVEGERQAALRASFGLYGGAQ